MCIYSNFTRCDVPFTTKSSNNVILIKILQCLISLSYLLWCVLPLTLIASSYSIHIFNRSICTYVEYWIFVLWNIMEWTFIFIWNITLKYNSHAIFNVLNHKTIYICMAKEIKFQKKIKYIVIFGYTMRNYFSIQWYCVCKKDT